MVFNKIPPGTFQNRSSLIAKEIIEKIHNSELQVGSKLLAERIIAEQMGVGRPAVREAICALQIAGIIESRPGDGNYVVKSNFSTQFFNQKESSALSLIKEGENPFEAFEARRAVEAHIVMLAAERRSPDDLNKLKESLDRIASSIKERNYDTLLVADMNFHEAIASAGGNFLLQKILSSLMEVMKKKLWVVMKKRYLVNRARNHLHETQVSHNEIYEAIVAKDGKRAVELMNRHFDEIESLFEQY
jgi:GntR family transcriptional repressor for pyruvate dehydrogenase complex